MQPGVGRLRSALRQDGGVAAFWFALGAPALVELALPAGPGAIVIDLQHGLWSRAALEAVLGVVPAGLPTIARLAGDAPEQIGEALDAGAEAVLVPLVESAEQAAACVAATHYPPRGRRSGGGVRPLAQDFVAYLAQAEARTCVGVMIETAAGVEAAESIAAVPGLDFVFVGTGDLALSLGCFPVPDERHAAACARVLAACRRNDLPCGIFTSSAEAAAVRRREGYALVVAGNDIDVVKSGFAAVSARAGAKGISA